jgi:poly-gamma-glutamate capsule biosynthesis protein CapA/YwtB (metallophosphatase superfamily)
MTRPIAELDSDRQLSLKRKILLCGDVMTGRGIDQVLPFPCDPRIHEPVVRSATEYVQLAEQVSGPIATPVSPEYVWGAALEELKAARADAYIVNLEVSITRSDTYVPKGINYRMSPENAACLSAGHVDCCVLANNHILDWGVAGLLETLKALECLGIKSCGAGRNLAQARSPAVLEVAGDRRVLVFAFASVTSGTPQDWAATESAAGVCLLEPMSEDRLAQFTHQLGQIKRPNDIVIVSLHWGSNWGYHIPEEQKRLARRLIDQADVSVVFGHSSHHAKAIEVYRNRLILYGCGDFLNDYEGITGKAEYRDDLALLYALDFEAFTTELADLEIVPFQIRGLQLVRASSEDIAWLQQKLDRQSQQFGVRIRLKPGGKLTISWAK